MMAQGVEAGISNVPPAYPDFCDGGFPGRRIVKSADGEPVTEAGAKESSIGAGCGFQSTTWITADIPEAGWRKKAKTLSRLTRTAPDEAAPSEKWSSLFGNQE